jgi:pimeloyl-ACP methyl ester carboxylesterase
VETFAWKGRRIAWERAGNGPPVVFCHGTPWSSSLWRPFAEALSSSFAALVRAYERFHRTLADRWAFRRFYSSESQRRKALPGFLHEYNHHRPHTALGGQPPITRLTNLSGQHT